MCPLPSSASPAGSAPETTDHAYGGRPPLATSAWSYAVPTTPSGTGSGAIAIVPHAGKIESVRLSVVPHRLESTTATENVTAPIAAGVPEITPAGERPSPAGSAP